VFHPEDGGDMFLRNISFYKNTQRHIPEDDSLHSHRRGNLKSYIASIFSVEGKAVQEDCFKRIEAECLSELKDDFEQTT
jgi:hypothetical protein